MLHQFTFPGKGVIVLSDAEACAICGGSVLDKAVGALIGWVVNKLCNASIYFFDMGVNEARAYKQIS